MPEIYGNDYIRIDFNGTNHRLKDTVGRALTVVAESSSTASAAHKKGEYFEYSGTLYIATADIASGGTITPGTNCVIVPNGLGGEVSNLKIARLSFVETDDIAVSALLQEIYVTANLAYGNLKIGNIAVNSLQQDESYLTRIVFLKADNSRAGSFSVSTASPAIPADGMYEISGVGYCYLNWSAFARIKGNTYSNTPHCLVAARAWDMANTNIIYNNLTTASETQRELDASTVFQKYDATMSAIIKNFKMVSDTYKYVAISDIRRNYSSKTGFIMYYYDNDTYAAGVRHTLLTAWGLSGSASEHYTKTFDNGGYVELDFNVSGQEDGYRNTTTTATNRIKPEVIQPIIETPYASNYGLNVGNFMLTSGNTPIFTWVDDDTDPTGVTRVKAICDTLGIKATFACVTDKLAENNGALASTLLGYQQEGFHITSHSHTHTKGTENDPFWYPTDYTDVALSEADLIESLATLNEYGFLDSNLFVTPGGNRNAALLKMISKWCPCVIGANGGANHKFGAGRANINRIFIRPEAEGGETLQTYKDMIDAAVTAGDWLIFGTHSGIPAQWDETLINNVLSYALTKNVDFMTLNQAWKIRKYNYDLYDMFT